LKGSGGLVLVRGDTGMGKTRLVHEVRDLAMGVGFHYLEGRCMYNEETVPFLPFLSAFNKVTDQDVIITSQAEKAQLHDVFLIHKSGLLICHAAREEGEEDEDILAGMLTAVQTFISDSFVDDGEERKKLIDDALQRLADQRKSKPSETRVGEVITGAGMFVRDAFAESALAKGLGRLEYGDTIILIEHGENVFCAGVVYGKDTPAIKEDLRRLVKNVEDKFSNLLSDWSGHMEGMGEIGGLVKGLTSKEYELESRMDERLLGMERTKMFQHVLDLILETAEGGPLMFFLDDLQWADASSLHLLHYLSRNIKSEKVAIFAAYRPEDATHILEDSLHRMEAENLYQEVCLESISKEAVRGLASELYPGLSLSTEAVRTIYRETEGNPFYTVEVLKNLAEEGVIYKKDGAWAARELAGVYIPQSMTDVIERRLNRLKPEDLDILTGASIFGMNLEYELLCFIMDVQDDKIVDALDRLVRQGILSEGEGEDYIFRFNQAPVQQVLYGRLSKLKCTMLHKKAALAIETLRHDSLEEYAPALTRHYAKTKSYEMMAKYGEMGGDTARKANSPEEAVELYKIALEALHKLGGKTEQDEKIHLKLYDVAYLMGDWEQAKTDALCLLKLAQGVAGVTDEQRVRGKENKAKRLLAEILVYQSQYSEAEAILNNVLEDSDEPIARAEAHYGIGRIHQRKGNLDMAMFSFERALEEAGKAGVMDLTAKINNDMGVVYDGMGEYKMSILYKEKALSAMMEVGDKYEIGRALNNLGVTYMYMGDVDSSLENLEQAIKVYGEMESAEGLAYSLSNAAEEYVLKGELDKAIDYCQKAMPIFIRTGDRIMAANTHMVYGMVYHKKGEWDMADFEFQKGIGMASELDIPQLLAQIYAEYGRMLVSKKDLARAREIFSTALEIWNEMGNTRRAVEIENELKAIG
ncbi:MAG: tetratricopeptide repeat protein, partial [Candidatus Thermoplasmatota archaeon]|nr:tetratricopeptide repeat protein [Candidatus Thermoplasmatota archaeon]